MRVLLACVVALALSAPLAQADTSALREVLSHPVATVADAYRGIADLALSAEQNQQLQLTGSFAAYREALVAADVVPAEWTYDGDSPATKRMMAYMICRAAGVKGGLTVRLFGLSQRYALRECIYLRIILPGADYTPISGREALAILKRAEDYMQGREIVLAATEDMR